MYSVHWALEIASELLHCGINYAVTLFAASPFNLSLIWTAFEILSSSSATLQIYKISLSHCKIFPHSGHKQCSTDRFHIINELNAEGKNEFVLYVCCTNSRLDKAIWNCARNKLLIAHETFSAHFQELRFSTGIERYCYSESRAVQSELAA